MSQLLQNDLILRAARGEKIERYPVWLMRQAGRILPEYRAVRASLSGFKELVETPKYAAEVTIQPVDLLGVDAAIIFSDIVHFFSHSQINFAHNQPSHAISVLNRNFRKIPNVVFRG